MNLLVKLEETGTYLKKHLEMPFDVGLILGSGLGEGADRLQDSLSIPYQEIPHFPISTVPGHAGRLVAGYLAEKKVLALQGRFHYYEGYTLEEVTYPVRVLGWLGVKHLIVTNAAGGIQDGLNPGDLMLIEDHLNFMGENPLRGKNYDELGTRFPDLSQPYDRELREKAYKAAGKLGIKLKEGVYAAVSGPSYETKAEILFLQKIGADAVGMSTVPEVIVANHGGMKVLAISCITNLATGLSEQPLSHREVVLVASRMKKDFFALLENIIGSI
ncbi:MAG TPA: purine-nucleoside phosphorylase [Clostridia bacterium]|nr:purine-nucleoside phosphorylase [Clostridia bacterium]